MKSKFIFALCMMILLIGVASAVQISYESAAVGRIVGDTPDELLQNLVQGSIDVNHADYYTNTPVHVVGESLSQIIANILKTKFYNDITAPISALYNTWDWSEINPDSNDLLIIKSQGSLENGIPKAKASGLYDVKSVYPYQLELNPGLAIFDSDYAGVYLPKQWSFVNSVKSPLIAPSSGSNEEFVRVLVCNLGKNRVLGLDYRDARNNYYWQSREPSGLALMSYMLYAPPYLSLSVPLYYSQSMDEYCKDYTGNFTFSSKKASSAKSMRISSVSKPESYTSNFVFDIADYSIDELANFSILTTHETNLIYEPYEIVLPIRVFTVKYPLKTVITNVSLIQMSNSADLSIPNMPSWEGEYVNRTCFYESKQPKVDFSHSFTDNNEVVLITINPMEVLNCTNGDFRLYRHFEYKIDYMPYSPVVMEAVDYPESADAGDEIEVSVFLRNILPDDAEGSIIIKDQDEILAEDEVSIASNALLQHDISFTIPSYSGLKVFDVEFMQDSDSKTHTSIQISINGKDFCTPVSETCNGFDDDCDDEIDEGACSAKKYYCDADNDSYYTKISQSCSSYNCIPSGCSDVKGNDCNDNSALINPGKNENAETCSDGIDNDCDLKIDSADSDCITNPPTYSEEICDGKDNDLDGEVDEVVRTVSCSFNMCTTNIIQKCVGGQWVGECAPFELNPENTYERCRDGIDNDCDGKIDLQDPECNTCSAGKQCPEHTKCRGKGTNDCCIGFCVPEMQ